VRCNDRPAQITAETWTLSRCLNPAHVDEMFRPGHHFWSLRNAQIAPA
jgi:hypothetical protein